MTGLLTTLLLTVAAAFTGLTVPAGATVSPAWTTYDHDLGRSGIDPDSTSPLRPTGAWQTSAPLDGDVYGQPLVYGPDVYVATENNSIYALDAATGRIVWHENAGTPVPEVSTSGCGDIGTVGITGTPVIDPATNRIYAVAETWDGSNRSSIHHRLVGYDVITGAPAQGLPVDVDPPGADPAELLQRPGLAIDEGQVVFGYGGHAGDCGTYHGWVVAQAETGAGPLRSFEADPHSLRGAVWGSGTGLPVDPFGDVYAATGNGAGSSYDLQESVVRLGPSMSLLDNWAPIDWPSLDNTDADIGSSEPVFLPMGLLFEIGKQGIGYLLSASSLGHGPGAPVFAAQVCGGAFGGGIYASGVIYVACTDGLHALSLDPATRSFAPLPGFSAPSAGIGPPIMAGGLVWSTNWHNGILYGVNPATGATVFSDTLLSFDHFASPSAGGGRLFVAHGNEVAAFTIGELTPVVPPTPIPARPIPPSWPGPPGHVAPIVSLISVRARAGRLRLTMSVASTLTVTVDRRAGRRLIRKRAFRFSAPAGANVLHLRLHGLRPGRYTAVIVARDSAGAVSRTYRAPFRILRRNR